MPANAAITINDGKTTPESHTFDPSDLNGTLASYTNFALSFPPGRETLRISRASKSSGKVREITMTIVIPKVVTTDGIDSVQDYRTYIVRCLMPASTPEADIDSDLGLVRNALSNANVDKVVSRGEWLW